MNDTQHIVERARQDVTQRKQMRQQQRQLRAWPWVLSFVLFVYAGVPWLSPLLRQAGFERAGVWLFNVYRTLCHQFAQRSFFVGQYQVCYCHRCTALYTSLFVMSVVYSVGRWRRALPWQWALLFTLPMVIDGGWHLVDDLLPWGLRSTNDAPGSPNFWLRMITGTLFGIGVVLWAYPRVQNELDHPVPRDTSTTQITTG
jgi:uncharacterized membrane protein